MNVGELQKALKRVNPELPVIIGVTLNTDTTPFNLLLDVNEAQVGSPFNKERWFIIKAQTEEKEEK